MWNNVLSSTPNFYHLIIQRPDLTLNPWIFLLNPRQTAFLPDEHVEGRERELWCVFSRPASLPLRRGHQHIRLAAGGGHVGRGRGRWAHRSVRGGRLLLLQGGDSGGGVQGATWSRLVQRSCSWETRHLQRMSLGKASCPVEPMLWGERRRPRPRLRSLLAVMSLHHSVGKACS